MGLLLLVGCFDSIENKVKETVVTLPIEEQKKVEKVKVEKKEELLFKEVTSLARLEFFKIDAFVNKKLLMVYFYSDNCYYCEKMKKETFSDFRVQEALKKSYSSVRINYSQHKQAFKKIFHLSATPAIVFFDREGNKIEDESFYGYQGAEDFYNKIELLAEPF
jgi:thiol:disulfide interchange protein DsbD